MSCLREVQTISKSPDILPMPSLTRLTTGGVLNPLKNTTKIGHNKLLHQEPLQPPLEPSITSSIAGIVGYDDIALASYPGCVLSSINRSPARLAQATMSAVLSVPLHAVTTATITPRLVVRRSSTRRGL